MIELLDITSEELADVALADLNSPLVAYTPPQNSTSGYGKGVLEYSAMRNEITGFEIKDDFIRDKNDSFGLAAVISTADDVRFWAGTTFVLRDSAPYRVYESGRVVSSDIVLEQQLVTGESFTGDTLPQPAFIGDASVETVRTNPNITASVMSLNLTKKVALKYVPGESLTVNQIELRAERDNDMTSNVLCSIQTDSAGTPSGTILGSGTILYSDINTGSPGNESCSIFTTSVELTSGTTYWVVIQLVTDSEAQDLYPQGNTVDAQTVAFYDGASWSTDTSAELSVALFCNLTAGSLWKSDASLAARAKFHGFVTSTTTMGGTATMAFTGKVPGMSGLSPGSKYYVSDTRAILSTSAGGTSVEVGTALTATALLIKGY